MHKLTRSPAIPGNLNAYQHGVDIWSNTSPTVAERANIWVAIESMQGSRCAYCEVDIANPDRHIEHFRQRSRYSPGTFSWPNLFGSCNQHQSCGKHKDSCTYNHSDLIKPDVEDPEYFFLFVTDGSITIRAGLTALEQHRASETKRIFNLDEEKQGLRWQRRNAVAGYLQTAETIADLALHFAPVDWEPILQEELSRVVDQPFVTAIRHALLPA